MADFPSYAALLGDNFKRVRNSAIERTPFEDGMVKQTKYKSRTLVTHQVVYKLATQTDYNNFVTWFKSTVNYGTDWFNWTDPTDGVVKLARIVEKIDEEAPADGRVTFWRVALRIETWSN